MLITTEIVDIRHQFLVWRKSSLILDGLLVFSLCVYSDLVRGYSGYIMLKFTVVVWISSVLKADNKNIYITRILDTESESILSQGYTLASRDRIDDIVNVVSFVAPWLDSVVDTSPSAAVDTSSVLGS